MRPITNRLTAAPDIRAAPGPEIIGRCGAFSVRWIIFLRSDTAGHLLGRSRELIRAYC
ncbi:hypothetical protein ACFLU1_05040 [Chloroflexota bacterium]